MVAIVKCERCNPDSIDTSKIRPLLIEAICAARTGAAHSTGGARFEFEAIATEIDGVLKRCFIAST